MDVVALAQSGFGNAVATLGTACTAEHVQKLFRFTDSVVFSFDGDAAGRRAAGRALEAAPAARERHCAAIRFLFLPPEHDPDSYVRELGADGVRAPASRRPCRCRASWSRRPREGCDLGTAEGRAHMLAQARPLWSAAARRRAEAPAAGASWRALARAATRRAAAPVGAGAAPARRPPPRRRAHRAARRRARAGAACQRSARREPARPRASGCCCSAARCGPARRRAPRPAGRPAGALRRAVRLASSATLHEHGPLAPARACSTNCARRRRRTTPAAAAVLAADRGLPRPGARGRHRPRALRCVRRRELRLHAVDDELQALFESGTPVARRA